MNELRNLFSIPERSLAKKIEELSSGRRNLKCGGKYSNETETKKNQE